MILNCTTHMILTGSHSPCTVELAVAAVSGQLEVQRRCLVVSSSLPELTGQLVVQRRCLVVSSSLPGLVKAALRKGDVHYPVSTTDNKRTINM